MAYEVELTSRFKKEFKKLHKKFKKLSKDFEELLDNLESNPCIGTKLSKSCYKIRVANSSIPIGKSGGFRVISLVKLTQKKVILLTIYSKSDMENISDKEIEFILKSLED